MARTSARPKKQSRGQVTLECKAENASEVFVAGTFNDWDATRDRLTRVGTDGCFRTSLTLPKGRHEYKFVVDNVWCADPQNPECAPNDQGSVNSVLVVP